MKSLMKDEKEARPSGCLSAIYLHRILILHSIDSSYWNVDRLADEFQVEKNKLQMLLKGITKKQDKEGAEAKQEESKQVEEVEQVGFFCPPIVFDLNRTSRDVLETATSANLIGVQV